MKKSFLILMCLLLVLSFVFVACGDDDVTEQPTQEVTEKTTEEPTEAPTTKPTDGEDPTAAPGEQPSEDPTTGNNTEDPTESPSDEQPTAPVQPEPPVEPGHKHTYDTNTWESDATGHWYASNCGHTSATSNFASHTDKDKDGNCDICAYAVCTHTYSKDWSDDETNHWREPVCGCKVDNKDLAAHVDYDKNGICDECEYQVCTHEYQTRKWSYDSTYHWKAATCGCKVDPQDKGEHKGMEDGICDVCEYGYHDHTWSDMKTDEDKHWIESTCTSHGAIVKADSEAEHTDEYDTNGICDVCKYVICSHEYGETWSYNEDGHFYAPICGCKVPNKGNEPHDTIGEEQSCSECGYTKHTHTESSVWSYNGTSHWKEYACGCTGIFEGTDVEHTGREDDGACDICTYGEHDHTWAADWKYDENDHWMESVCAGHNVVIDKKAAHTDINDDGICDGCSWNFDHTHSFDDAIYVADQKGHWHPTICFDGETPIHVNVKGSFEAHDTLGVDENGNADFSCSVCGNPSFKVNIDNAINAADKVNGGSVETEDGYNKGQIEYAFGKDYTYINKEDISEMDMWNDEWTEILYQYESSNTWEYWHHNLGEGKVFSLMHYIYGKVDGEIVEGTTYDYGVQKDTEAGEGSMLGNAFTLGFIDWSLADTTYYGVENFIAALYNFAVTSETVNGNVNATVDGNNYAFTFECLTGGTDYGTYKIVEVSFTLDANNVITKANVDFEGYWDPTDDPASNEEGKDYYVKVEDGKYTAVLLKHANPDETYSMSITQTAGDRNATSPYDVDELIIRDFTIVDGATEEEITEESVYTLGSEILIGISGIKPETSDISYDTPELLITVNGNALSEWSYPWYDSENGVYVLYPDTAGVWEIVFTTTDAEKAVSFTVEAPAVSELNPVVNYMWTNEYTVNTGMSFDFTAEANMYADPDFTASCDDANVTLTKNEVVDYTYTFTASVAGQYTVTLTSVSNPSVTATLVVTVEDAEAADWDEILASTHAADLGYGDSVTLTFDTATNTATVVGLWWGTPYTDTYTYEIVDGVFTATLNEGGAGKLTNLAFNGEKFEVYFSETMETHVLEASEGGSDIPDEPVNVADILKGTYEGSIFYMTNSYEVIAEFTPAYAGATNGTLTVTTNWFSFNPKGAFKYVGTYEYTWYEDSEWCDIMFVEGQMYSVAEDGTETAVEGEAPVGIILNTNTMTVQVMEYGNYSTADLYQTDSGDQGGDEPAEFDAVGTWSGAHAQWGECFSMTLNGDGTGTFFDTFNTEDITEFTYVVDGDVITMTVVVDAYPYCVGSSEFTVSGSEIIMADSYGDVYTFTKASGGDEGGDEGGDTPEAPNMAEILKGEYEGMFSIMAVQYSVNVVFTPAFEGAVNGTMVVTYEWRVNPVEAYKYVGNYEYTWYADSEYCDIMLASGQKYDIDGAEIEGDAPASIIWNSSTQTLQVMDFVNYSTTNLTPVTAGGDVGGTFDPVGTWSGAHAEWGECFSMTLNGDGTGTFFDTFNTEDITEFTYAVDGDVITMTVVVDAYPYLVGGAEFTVSGSEIIMADSYGDVYTFTKI